MENDDTRNIVEPKESRNLIARGVPTATCKAVRVNAASVPGYEALMIGFMNRSSNSLVKGISRVRISY